MDLAIKIRGLSKRYRIGARAAGGSLREAVSRTLSRPFRPAHKGNAVACNENGSDFIWALKDVSFHIGKGEVIGVIGRNGAGKSTLLKILSRVTAPTEGQVEIYGSMASLLEVGTGFHPELTGRENIYLNGSILGMSRALIRQHFDEIVAFADIGRFLDTPVKHYSSGMYVRLAFAVAAHLKSDILLLDEVLAVGDVGFQKKCLAKMGDVAGQGRSVIFVSHSMVSVRQLCSRCVLIDRGRIIDDGPTPVVLRTFSEKLRAVGIDEFTHLKDRTDGHSGAVRFTRFRIEDQNGAEKYDFFPGDTIRVRVDYRVFEDVPDLCLYFALTSETSGETLSSVKYTLSEGPLKKEQRGTAVIEFPQIVLRPHEYHPYVWLGSRMGLPFDRLNYYLTSCPPLIINHRSLGPEHSDGYFDMSSRLIVNS